MKLADLEVLKKYKENYHHCSFQEGKVFYTDAVPCCRSDGTDCEYLSEGVREKVDYRDAIASKKIHHQIVMAAAGKSVDLSNI